MTDLTHPFGGRVRDPRDKGGVGDYFIYLSARGFASSLFTPEEHATVTNPFAQYPYSMGYTQLYVAEKTAMVRRQRGKRKTVEGGLPSKADGTWFVFPSTGRAFQECQSIAAALRHVDSQPDGDYLISRCIENITWH